MVLPVLLVPVDLGVVTRPELESPGNQSSQYEYPFSGDSGRGPYPFEQVQEYRGARGVLVAREVLLFATLFYIVGAAMANNTTSSCFRTLLCTCTHDG